MLWYSCTFRDWKSIVLSFVNMGWAALSFLGIYIFFQLKCRQILWCIIRPIMAISDPLKARNTCHRFISQAATTFIIITCSCIRDISFIQAENIYGWKINYFSSDALKWWEEGNAEGILWWKPEQKKIKSTQEKNIIALRHRRRCIFILRDEIAWWHDDVWKLS